VTFPPKTFNSVCECLGGVEILRKVFEAKTDESNIKKKKRKLRKHLHLYSSLDIFVTEARRLRILVHDARMCILLLTRRPVANL
jgi:hypothetical protein